MQKFTAFSPVTFLAFFLQILGAGAPSFPGQMAAFPKCTIWGLKQKKIKVTHAIFLQINVNDLLHYRFVTLENLLRGQMIKARQFLNINMPPTVAGKQQTVK